jgi:hypothetical protein
MTCDPQCGDNNANCPQDCAPGCTCGDMICNSACGEDEFTCPDDCATLVLPDLTIDATMLQQTANDPLNIWWQNFPSTSCELVEQCVAAAGNRRLLNFDVSIPNFGNAPLSADQTQHPEWFEFDSCHGHYHFKNFTQYRLLDAQNNEVGYSHKQSYFLVDVLNYWPNYPSGQYTGMGISPGWSDVYSVGTPCQWIDITGVAAGTYTLEVSVNPGELLFPELQNHPNTVSVPVTIPP